MSIETLQTIQQRLQFGVPLEEAFYSKFAVHPALLNAFKQSYDCVVSCGYPITTVIRLQGTLHERLALKETLALCKNLAKFNCPPGACLWVIRHYLGLLPIQILPKRTGNTKFIWWRIGKQCERILRNNNHFAKNENETEITYQITNELLRLSLPNFLLFMSVMSFLRALAVLPNTESGVNKKALFALVKYYSSSIFVRPFRPGTINKNETEYCCLLTYLILRWPNIHKSVMKASSYTLRLPLNSFELGAPPTVQVTSKLRSNGATQTTAKCRDAILRVIPDWYRACEFVRDNSSQTDDVCEEELQLKQKSNKQIYCCCCVMKLSLKNRRNKSTQSYINESWDSESVKEFSDNAEFLYDEYSRCNLIGDDYETLKDFEPHVKTDSLNIEAKSSSYDIQAAINKELKARFALMGMKQANQDLIDVIKRKDENPTDKAVDIDDSLFSRENSFEKIPSEIADSNKTLVNVKKIRSKLEFLRVFKSVKYGKNISFEKFKSEIKYQKI